MPQGIISQFDRQYASPIETWRQVQTAANRDAIPNNIRWQGMLVYVVSDSTTYELQGGLGNGDWVDLKQQVSVAVVDDLLSTSPSDALSANQGNVLKALADSKLGDAPIDGSEYVRLNGAWAVATGGGGGGAVDSVFGRTGAVVAQSGDYASFYATATHTHTTTDITDLGSYAGFDSRYYTETESDANFAPISHTHTTGDITNLSSYTGLDSRYYTESEIDANFAGLSTANTFIGQNTFTNPNLSHVVGGTAEFNTEVTTGGTDSKKWDEVTTTTQKLYRILNDANSVGNPFITVTRSGMTVSSLNLEATDVQANGNTIWHTGNDGNLLKSNVSDVFTGTFLRWEDNSSARFGTGDDFRILHTGSEARLQMIAGDLKFTDGLSTARFTFERTTGDLTMTGDSTALDHINTSDLRLKRDITTYKPRPINVNWVTFRWKGDTGKRESPLMVGAIAQQVETDHPEFIVTDPETGMKAIRMNSLFAAKLAELEQRIKIIENGYTR